MNKFRSTVNPVTIIVNIILNAVLILLAYFKSRDFFWAIVAVIAVSIVISIVRFTSYKYFFENKGLVIIHRRQRYLIPYKNVKYVEINSRQTGMIYGYGLRRILIAAGKGIEELYLVTPEKENEFLEILEKKVDNAKKGTK